MGKVWCHYLRTLTMYGFVWKPFMNPHELVLYLLDIPTDICFFISLFLFHNYLYNCTSYNHVKTRLKCSRSYDSHGIMRQMIILKTSQFLWTRSMENRRKKGLLVSKKLLPKNVSPSYFSFCTKTGFMSHWPENDIVFHLQYRYLPDNMTSVNSMRSL